MDKNSPEDWLKLLLMSTGEDKYIMCKLFAKSREIDTHINVLDTVIAEESGKAN